MFTKFYDEVRPHFQTSFTAAVYFVFSMRSRRNRGGEGRGARNKTLREIKLATL